MRISLLKQLLSILKLKLSRTTFYGGMLPLLQLTFLENVLSYIINIEHSPSYYITSAIY